MFYSKTQFQEVFAKILSLGKCVEQFAPLSDDVSTLQKSKIEH